MGLLALALGLSIHAFAAAQSPAVQYTTGIQKSLEEARTQLHVLQKEVSKTAPGAREGTGIDKSARSVSTEITQALSQHEKLRRLSDSDLSVRKNPAYRGLNAALSQLSMSNRNLETRISDHAFTKDKQTALSDLSIVDSSLSQGISRAKALNQEMASR